MKRSNRLGWLGAMALGVMILLSFIVAPSSSKINTGSTYSRAADGYGAWYAFMQQQGISIQRWQKPRTELKAKSPVTLLRVYSHLNYLVLDIEEQEWVEKGNTLVILGVSGEVTAAKFNTTQKSPFGDVKIATGRRQQKVEPQRVSLGDRFGAIVWEEKHEQGKVIFSTTPYLAANAYQDSLSNFKYLAALTRQKNHPVFVDEYIHGYKDADVQAREGKGNLVSYLVKMPLFTAFLQAIVLLFVLIWSQNRRFGKPVTLDTPSVDNSTAYIQALAGVLQKAESTDFVLEMVGKAEQLELQKALGLGQLLLEPEALIDVWVQKTGLSAAELEAVLKLQAPGKKSISEPDLLSWLGKWRSLHLGTSN